MCRVKNRWILLYHTKRHVVCVNHVSPESMFIRLFKCGANFCAKTSKFQIQNVKFLDIKYYIVRCTAPCKCGFLFKSVYEINGPRFFSFYLNSTMDKQVMLDIIRDRRLSLIDTVQELERKSLNSVAIFQSQLLPTDEMQDLLLILAN